MRRIFTDDDDRLLVANYALWGTKRCAEALGRGIRPLQVAQRVAYLRSLGRTNVRVDPAVHSANLRAPKPPRPERVPIAQFESPNTPEVAYLLGLLWADGCAYRGADGKDKVIINMVAEDLTSVESVFDATGEWSKYVSVKRTGRTQRTFVVCGSRLVTTLEQFGYRSKSGVPLVLGRIPETLIPLWFRGVMDGDGSFYIGPNSCGANVCGPHDQDWSYLTGLMDLLGVRYTVRVTGSAEQGGTRSLVTVSDLRSVARWGDYLYASYPQDRIGLPRKRVKFLQLKERYEQSAWWRRFHEREAASAA